MVDLQLTQTPTDYFCTHNFGQIHLKDEYMSVLTLIYLWDAHVTGVTANQIKAVRLYNKQIINWLLILLITPVFSNCKEINLQKSVIKI